MGHSQAESKKKTSSGSGFDLYGGVFSNKIFGSKPSMNQPKYNAGSGGATYMNADTFKDDERGGPLYWVEDKDKDKGSHHNDNCYYAGGEKNIAKPYNGIGIEKSFASMTLTEVVPYKKENPNKQNMDSKLADASNLGSTPPRGSPLSGGNYNNNNVGSKMQEVPNLGSTPVRNNPTSGGVMTCRKSSDWASSSSSGSSGSVSGGASTKGGGRVPIVGTLKVDSNHHQNNDNNSTINRNNHSGEFSVGSVSSGGSSSGGSPTAESVRRGARSQRLGNVLNPKTLGNITGDSKESSPSPGHGGLITGGGLSVTKKPGHSRGSSYGGSSSRSSGELASVPTVNSRPLSGPQVPTGNIHNAGLSKGSSGSTLNANNNGGHLSTGNILANGNFGNILNSGRIASPPTANPHVLKGSNAKADGAHAHHILGSGNVNYGVGSIVKGIGKSDSSAVTGNIHVVGESILLKRVMASTDPEDVKNAGNDQYKKGHFAEALCLYDRAISLCPGHAPYRSNRAAALTGLGRYVEAVEECLDAIRLDPSYGRAHHRLGSLYLKLGQVENAKRQFNLAGQHSDRADIQKVQTVERFMIQLEEARKVKDWKSVLKDSDAAIVAGADSSPQVFASKAEALLKLHRLDEADAVLTSADKVGSIDVFTHFHGIVGGAYVCFVRAQVDMSLGRFESAVAAAEKAARIDLCNKDVSSLLRNARTVANARSNGNELFKVGKFSEACVAYGEGLQYDPMNPVLLSNRAACRSKLGQWEKSVEDCNLAISIQPNYVKALLRRAQSNTQLERWKEALKDYEVLRKYIPGDREVAQSLFYVQVELKKSRGEEIYNMKFGGQVEVVDNSHQFREAISSPGLAVVHFKSRSSEQCRKMSPFIDELCGKYPSVNFLKVDIGENPNIAKSESISFVPTFKIYKNGVNVKEMLGPSKQVLENSVKHYSL